MSVDGAISLAEQPVERALPNRDRQGVGALCVQPRIREKSAKAPTPSRSRFGNTLKVREKCDNGAYAPLEMPQAQVVNKRVLVIYREAARPAPYRDALIAAGLNPV